MEGTAYRQESGPDHDHGSERAKDSDAASRKSVLKDKLRYLRTEQLKKWFLLAVLALATPMQVELAFSMDYHIHPSNKSETLNAILATGDIKQGDVAKLELFLGTLPPRRNTAIYLASPGGDLYEGIRLGLFFKHKDIKTVVEGGHDCASACAIAFLGGTDSFGHPWRSSSTNSRLGFHAFIEQRQSQYMVRMLFNV